MLRRAEIAGGGFAGLSLALALSQRGWDVRLHERAAESRAFGAGIYLWENGLRVLQALGVQQRVLDEANDAPAFCVRDADGNLLSRKACGAAIGTRMIGMTRETLHRALLDAALASGVKLRMSSHIVSASSDGALTDASGRTWEADLVVGADGVTSKVSQSLGLLDSRTVLTKGAVRTLVPRTQDDMSMDVVTYMASCGARILATPCNGDEIYLALMHNESDPALRAAPLDRAAWQAAFPCVAHLVGQVDPNARYDDYQIIRVKAWSQGRAAIIGDAAHGLPPSLGQGAGLALMNALSMAFWVDGHEDIAVALRTWEARERPLTDYTQQMSCRLVEAADRFQSATIDPWADEYLRTARHQPTGAEVFA